MSSPTGNDNLHFENAMLCGINSILLYYDSFVVAIANRHEDRSRAPLNALDLAQEARRVVVRCWEKQRQSVDVKNFDLLVKSAVKRALLSQIGREYCLKRGRHTQSFLSELTGSDIDDPLDYETILFHAAQEGTYQQSRLEDLILQISAQLVHPRLQRIFCHIVTDHQFEDLNPRWITPQTRTQVALALQISEHDLVRDLEAIQFTMLGFSETFRTESFTQC